MAIKWVPPVAVAVASGQWPVASAGRPCGRRVGGKRGQVGRWAVTMGIDESSGQC